LGVDVVTIYELSLDRLLDGMAQALLEVVLPSTTDDYAQTQIRAIVELLFNLSDRVMWTPQQIERKTRFVNEALATLGEPSDVEPGEDPVAQLRSARQRLVARIPSLYAHGEPDPRVTEAIWRAIASDFEDERASIRTGALRR
jgi:hypothetical protein